MKTYVLTLSSAFPSTHPRAGEPTEFKERLRKTKLHTIRANYGFWESRFRHIEAGEACLSIRQWTGKPYYSKQVEIARLTKDDGIGLQRLDFYKDEPGRIAVGFGISDPDRGPEDWEHVAYPTECNLANNDGLSLRDWKDWFKGYDKSKPMAIIHFTPFRYKR